MQSEQYAAVIDSLLTSDKLELTYRCYWLGISPAKEYHYKWLGGR